MPGYGNSMGSMSFRNRGLVSSRKEDWEGAQVKSLWTVIFSVRKDKNDTRNR